MPQLDISTFLPQIFWLAVTFIVLYVVLSRRVLPKIGDVIEARAKRIANDLEAAEALKRESELAIKTYEAALAKARANAQVVIAEAKAAMATDAAKRLAELDDRLDREATAAEQRIESARDRAKTEVRLVAQEAAISITRRLVGIDVSADRATQAVATELKGQ
ncbi:MAG: F0F1 ATP synthase subunit B' [Alphaproteobacteria bacterium]|nr:F0F1 ATP synthase subunit B' [Alphaproteobacteria bacterium]